MLENAELVLFVTPIALSCSTLAATHWFPWHNGTQPLQRTTAYAVGTSVVVGFPVLAMLISAAWQLDIGALFWALLLMANVAASGTTVLAAYWIDGRRALSGNEVHDATQRR